MTLDSPLASGGTIFILTFRNQPVTALFVFLFGWDMLVESKEKCTWALGNKIQKLKKLRIWIVTCPFFRLDSQFLNFLFFISYFSLLINPLTAIISMDFCILLSSSISLAAGTRIGWQESAGTGVYIFTIQHWRGSFSFIYCWPDLEQEMCLRKRTLPISGFLSQRLFSWHILVVRRKEWKTILWLERRSRMVFPFFSPLR